MWRWLLSGSGSPRAIIGSENHELQVILMTDGNNLDPREPSPSNPLERAFGVAANNQLDALSKSALDVADGLLRISVKAQA